MTNLEKAKLAKRVKRSELGRIIGFAFVVLVIALGALMMASSITYAFSKTTIIFGNTDPVFEFFVGFAFVIIAANLIPEVAPRDTRE